MHIQYACVCLMEFWFVLWCLRLAATLIHLIFSSAHIHRPFRFHNNQSDKNYLFGINTFLHNFKSKIIWKSHNSIEFCSLSHIYNEKLLERKFQLIWSFFFSCLRLLLLHEQWRKKKIVVCPSQFSKFQTLSVHRHYCQKNMRSSYIMLLSPVLAFAAPPNSLYA